MQPLGFAAGTPRTHFLRSLPLPRRGAGGYLLESGNVRRHPDPRDPPMNDPHHAPSPGLPFSEADWKEFHSEDIKAGRAVVVLMTAIFSMGVILYTIVMATVLM